MRCLAVAVLAAFWLASCGDPDPRCNSRVAEFPDDAVLASIPYQNGEIVNFRTSAGGQISTVTERFTEDFPDRTQFCAAIIRVELNDSDTSGVFAIDVKLEGLNGGYYDYTIHSRPNISQWFDVDIRTSSTIRANEIAPSSNQRLIVDTILNGTNYAEVLEGVYPYAEGEQISSIYYNRTGGILQINHVDGWQIYRE